MKSQNYKNNFFQILILAKKYLIFQKKLEMLPI